MKNWITAVIIISILIGVGYVFRYCTESPDLPTEVPPNDTLYVYGDTVWVPQDTIWTIKWKKIPAVTTIDSSGLVTKRAEKDTVLVHNKDTISVNAKVEYIPEEDLFNLALDIEHKDYDSFRVDTQTITEYVPVEVETGVSGWWVVSSVGMTLALIASFIFGG